MLREGSAPTPDNALPLPTQKGDEVARPGDEVAPIKPPSGLTGRQVEQTIVDRLGWNGDAMVNALANHHAWLMNAEAGEWTASMFPVVCHDHA